MRTTPGLSWLNGKTFVNSIGGKKNRPGRKPEHTMAQTHALGLLAQAEFDKSIGITPLKPESDLYHSRMVSPNHSI